MLASRQDSVVVVVDMQPTFLAAIFEKDRVLKRCRFLVEMAFSLGVPVLATEQNVARMGGTEESLAALFALHGVSPVDKMCFSCCGSAPFMSLLEETGRKQVILVGIETHICINQTAHDLLESEMDFFHGVLIGADTTSSRSLEMHKVGLKRLRDAGAVIAHTESIAYEWLQSADDPQFRDALKLVKGYSES
ncbi:MAG TPA: isochorismatase family protein [Fimbriimonadaceae bacterium]|jgi:isochorismate hydrolase